MAHPPTHPSIHSSIHSSLLLHVGHLVPRLLRPHHEPQHQIVYSSYILVPSIRFDSILGVLEPEALRHRLLLPNHQPQRGLGYLILFY